jgi:hypothetical protein
MELSGHSPAAFYIDERAQSTYFKGGRLASDPSGNASEERSYQRHYKIQTHAFKPQPVNLLAALLLLYYFNTDFYFDTTSIRLAQSFKTRLIINSIKYIYEPG